MDGAKSWKSWRPDLGTSLGGELHRPELETSAGHQSDQLANVVREA